MSGRLMHGVLVLLTVASLIFSPICAQAEGGQNQTTPTAQQPIQAAQAPVQAPPQIPPMSVALGPNEVNAPKWFPNITAPYKPMHLPEPVLINSPKIEQLIQGNKLLLSLGDALSLALENNLAIQIERYVPELDEANLLYAQSGANGRILFDPLITSTLALQQTSIPVNNPILSGTGTGTSGVSTPVKIAPSSIVNHNAIYNFQYAQNFPTGTQFLATFNNTRGSTSSPNDLLNPFVQSSLTLLVTQPLLNGFGRLVNTRYIIEARNSIKVGRSLFTQQVMTTVTQVANQYWELVFARENVKVEQTAVAADQQLYENNKKQLEIGTMAPLDVITAESQLASDQQLLVQAQTTQLQDEITLLNSITKDPLAGQLNGIEVVPTTSIFTPDMENIGLQDASREAWQKRPEIQQAELNLKNAGIEIDATHNLLLPQVNLFGQYQAAGLGGLEKIRSNSAFAANLSSPIVDATGTPIPGFFEPSAVTSTSVFPGGFGDDLSRLFGATYPTFQAGFNITLPIRNRAAQANNAIAQINQREQEAQYQQLKNTITVAVRVALIALEQGRAAVTAASQARNLAQQSYDDEVKKFQLGSSTAFTVTQKQQILTAAAGTELRDQVNLIEAEVNFNQAMGRTLDVNHISLTDVQSGGSPSGTPNIPGTPSTPRNYR